MSGHANCGSAAVGRHSLGDKPALVVQSGSGPSLAAGELRRDEAGTDHELMLPSGNGYVITAHLQNSRGRALTVDGRTVSVDQPVRGSICFYALDRSVMPVLGSPFHLVWFWIPAPVLDRHADQIGAPRPGALSVRSDRVYDDPVIRVLAESLVHSFAAMADTDNPFARHLALAMLAHIAHAYGGLRAPARSLHGGLAPWQEQRAKSILREAMNADITLEAIADECGLSLTSFTRAFRKSTGLPPYRWLLTQRVERAKALLEASDLPLVDVALSCGFADQSHFSRVFLRIAGCTPGARRKEPRAARLVERSETATGHRGHEPGARSDLLAGAVL